MVTGVAEHENLSLAITKRGDARLQMYWQGLQAFHLLWNCIFNTKGLILTLRDHMHHPQLWESRPERAFFFMALGACFRRWHSEVFMVLLKESWNKLKVEVFSAFALLQFLCDFERVMRGPVLQPLHLLGPVWALISWPCMRTVGNDGNTVPFSLSSLELSSYCVQGLQPVVQSHFFFW